jgi:hypothetical protein
MEPETYRSRRQPLLIGSTFPLSLIRRPALIEPAPEARLREEAQHRVVVSFWGHKNTLPRASERLGIDLTPNTDRPALTLNADGLPMLHGITFTECWVLSPEYAPGFRPAVGEEVPSEKILDWQVLRIQWR